VSIPEGSKVISTIAFAHPLKGVDILVRAIPEIPDAIFLIIGLNDCEYTNELVTLANSLGVNDRIRWIGITDNVVEYLQLTDLYVQPSRTEALSLAACEALALGVPVVGSNVGGLPEVALRVFERENHHQLAEIINGILKDSSLYNDLTIQSLNSFQQKFRLSDAIETYSSIYRN
jgi:glycosyltransferase involved in cell wall biosynthesis